MERFFRLLLFAPSSLLCGSIIFTILLIAQLILFFAIGKIFFVYWILANALSAVGIYYLVLFSLKIGINIAPKSKNNKVIIVILSFLILLPLIYYLVTPAIYYSGPFNTSTQLFLTGELLDKLLVTTFVLLPMRKIWKIKSDHSKNK